MDGIINVYKEAGFTSHDVVAKLRGICRQKKIGHTGTLDPQATGVLPVCLGNATRACEMLTDRTKEYVAELLLGQITDTQDTTGTVLEEREVAVDEAQVREVIAGFVGGYDQIPPMYSALKLNHHPKLNREAWLRWHHAESRPHQGRRIPACGCPDTYTAAGTPGYGQIRGGTASHGPYFCGF